MRPKHQRLVFILVGLVFLAISAMLVLNNFNDNLVFFYSPSDLLQKKLPDNKTIRIGGLVEDGSIKKAADGITTSFIITDLQESIQVQYKGILPPLFREGQGMIAKGNINPQGIFIADSLLTKHDENYMPPEVAESLKKAGKWKANK